MAKKRKTPKATILKAHRIARKIKRSKRAGRVRNVWAVGMAVAKGTARRRKSKRRKR